MAKPSGFATLHKKASLVGAFFVGVCWHGAVLALCPSPAPVRTLPVTQVLDGDTLRLANGRSVRLIGLDAPELGRGGQPAAPFAGAAKRRLQALVDANGGRVGLLRGKQGRDRHGRALAHVYGRNGDNLAARLLREGLGLHTAIAPNSRFAGCLAQAEQAARQARAGLWQGRPQRPARALRRSGFALLEGRVTQLKRSNGALSLLLDDHLLVRIPARLLRTAPRGFVDNLKGSPLEVRGWVTPLRRSAPAVSKGVRWQLVITDWHMLTQVNR